MTRMISLLLLLLSIACSPDLIDVAAPTRPSLAWEETPTGGAPGTGEGGKRNPLDTTYGQKLGVNFTWAADQRITGDPTYAAGAFRHVRYFQMMEKDFAGATPATATLAPCTNVANPWACPERSMRQHLIRVSALRQMFPEGKIWIAPEVLAGRGWPCKGYTAAELGADPEEAGYQWARAALATYGPVGGVILAMTNEEWCAGADRVAAYNDWRRGMIRAHRENPSCELALGATHLREREWQGVRMPDNVADVAPEVWQYLDSVNGWADFHAHGIEHGRFLPHAEAHTATDYADFFAWNTWVRTKFPNVRTAVGEIAYTTNAPGTRPTAATKLADWPTYRSLIERVAEEADLVFLYQVEEQASPEGAFSGSGIFPDLRSQVETLARTSLEPLD